MSQEQNNQNQQEPIHQSPIQIGVAWNQVSKKGNEYVSTAFTGGREKDEYEVILRHKGTQEELDLFNSEHCSVAIYPNKFKSDKEEDAKKPDFVLKAFLK